MRGSANTLGHCFILRICLSRQISSGTLSRKARRSPVSCAFARRRGLCRGEFVGVPHVQNGQVFGLLGITRDITERKRVRTPDRLRHFYVLLLTSAHDGIYGVDLQGQAIFVNPAAAHDRVPLARNWSAVTCTPSCTIRNRMEACTPLKNVRSTANLMTERFSTWLMRCSGERMARVSRLIHQRPDCRAGRDHRCDGDVSGCHAAQTSRTKAVRERGATPGHS